MRTQIIRLLAMLAIGVGIILIAVAIRDTVRSAGKVAHAQNNAVKLVAVPTAEWANWQFSSEVPVASGYVVEVR